MTLTNLQVAPLVADAREQAAALADAPAVQPGPTVDQREKGEAFRERLTSWRFWMVQALVIAVTVIHGALEVWEPFHLDAMYFLPSSLYLFPVLYASLNFGTRGAIPTAIWSAALTLPNIVLLHDGMEALGETFQVSVMLFLGTVVAQRMEKEQMARRTAEAAEHERRASEFKYRSLFDGAGEAILLLDASGTIREANAAALALMREEHGDPLNKPVSEVLGQQAGEAIRSLRQGVDAADVAIRRPDGMEVWVEPRLTDVQSGASLLTQVLLRDVTDRHSFQHYAQEVVKAQERERQRIAQELHDVSVQSSILVCRRLDAATDALEGGNSEKILHELSEARTTAENMADELRRFSRDLRPLMLEDLGLVPALKRLLMELRERGEIRVRFRVTGTVKRLDSATEVALFRIVQESIRNVQRHSKATGMSVTLAFGAESVRLSVVDNGRGFKVPALPALVNEGRLGLLGMQERARQVGGRCEIQSDLRAGTRVIAEVPVQGMGPDHHAAPRILAAASKSSKADPGAHG